VTTDAEETTEGSAEPAGRGRRDGLDPRGWRPSEVRIFSSGSDAPRARRPTDVVLLVLSIFVVVGVSFVAPGPTAIDSAVADVVTLLPGLFGWFWEIAYDLLIGWALVLLALSLFARGASASWPRSCWREGWPSGSPWWPARSEGPIGSAA
jgi:hypothetical protein